MDIIVENNVAQISKFDLRFINEYLLIKYTASYVAIVYGTPRVIRFLIALPQ